MVERTDLKRLHFSKTFLLNEKRENKVSALYSLILIINLTPNVGITPNANFQSHIIQSNLSKDECMRQAYHSKRPTFLYKKQWRGFRIFSKF